MKNYFYLIGCLFLSNLLYAQEGVIIPDLSKVNQAESWYLHNRQVKYENAVHLDAKEGDGLLQMRNFDFENGRIELMIRGANTPGQSFVGFAFHVQNDSTFNAVYFRPFNFRNPERNGHSVQYISHPKYTWFKLREDSPEKYENKVSPVPDPDNWFKATIVVDYPRVIVFVNDSGVPSLEVEILSDFRKGDIGFWVGNGSKGSFKDLKITPQR